MKKSAYARAGVDIDEKMNGLASVRGMINRTAVKGVLGGVGAFGGFFRAPGESNILVASTDGVGTKLKVAVMAKRHDTVGRDIVNHCVNDILVHGAKPLFFLDYIGSSKITGQMIRSIITGICAACRENGCALLAGETAEMPGMYPKSEYDLVGTIIGVVPERTIITGRAIRPGDVIIGLHSSGLHTNGYSLARKVIFEQAGLKTSSILPGTRVTVADALLAVHRSYLKPVQALIRQVPVQGMAHITGGGFPDNIERVMPAGTCAELDASTWKVPALFRFIQKAGHVDTEEMYRVFNMGIGMTIFVRAAHARKALGVLARMKERPVVIGRVTRGKVPVRFQPPL